MADIRHRVGIGAPPDRAYQALATPEGLSGGWTREVSRAPGVGGKLQFFSGHPDAVTAMEVTERPTKWAVLLPGLKAGLEGGKATPFPDDPGISSWG